MFFLNGIYNGVFVILCYKVIKERPFNASSYSAFPLGSEIVRWTILSK